MALKVEIIGQRALQNAFKKAQITTHIAIKELVSEAAIDVQREAKLRCPVDTGRLRNSIKIEFIEKGLAASVGTNVEYAPYVEFGTRPHPVNPKVLKRWVERKKLGKGAEFRIAKIISKKGTKPHPFLNPAFEQVRPKFRAALRKLVK